MRQVVLLVFVFVFLPLSALFAGCGGEGADGDVDLDPEVTVDGDVDEIDQESDCSPGGVACSNFMCAYGDGDCRIPDNVDRTPMLFYETTDFIDGHPPASIKIFADGSFLRTDSDHRQITGQLDAGRLAEVVEQFDRAIPDIACWYDVSRLGFEAEWFTTIYYRRLGLETCSFADGSGCGAFGRLAEFMYSTFLPSLAESCTDGDGGGGCDGDEGIDGDPDAGSDEESDSTSDSDAEEGVAGCRSQDDCPDLTDYCFIREGEATGACVPHCDRPGSLCPEEYYCDNIKLMCLHIAGFCRQDSDCADPSREVCALSPGETWGICIVPCNLPGERCPELLVCDEIIGRCVNGDVPRGCSYDQDCTADKYCDRATGLSRGFCRSRCNDLENPCPAPLCCHANGRCVIADGGRSGCVSVACGGGCPPGFVCEPLFDACVLNCPACPCGSYCDALTAPHCVTGSCVQPVVCGITLPPCCPGSTCSATVYGVLGFCEGDGCSASDGDGEVE